jgi:hypothetical protein
MLKSLAILFALSLPAQAQEVLAEYRTDSGSLPPEYAWATTVTILVDGQLTLKHCTGYETEGPACKIRHSKVAEAALSAIRKAAAESEMVTKAARLTDIPMVGGGSISGRILLDGSEIILPSQPAKVDVARVEKVLTAIAAAIPPRFSRFLAPD